MYTQLRRIDPRLADSGSVLLQLDNARPHVAKIPASTIQQCHMEMLPHPAYSPDIAPSDYYLFKHLKAYISQKIFNNEGEVRVAIDDFISSQDSDFWRRGIYSLPDRWKRVRQNNGAHI